MPHKTATRHLATKRRRKNFWEERFGRPMDSYHTVTKAEFKENDKMLAITFDNKFTNIRINPNCIC